jgi:NAD(P)-dependent dehydrogenase (short-subunit alcohol dehydrogenase family)
MAFQHRHWPELTGSGQLNNGGNPNLRRRIHRALSKAALAQLARNLAVELGPFNIRANAIAPGFIRTDLAKPLLVDEQFMSRRMRNTPLRRPGEPHEVAAVALFLAAAGGGFVTGQTILVNGGTSIMDGS